MSITLSDAEYRELALALADTDIAQRKSGTKSYLPPEDLGPDSAALNALHAKGDVTAQVVTIAKSGYFPPGITPERLKGININSFPRGDIDNFSMTRLMLAHGKAIGGMGEAAYRQFAPWEWQYQQALEKANLGDQVSGQDGGFLAPEMWSQDFYDRLYPQMVIGQLPVTRIRMSARTQHFPKLVTGAVVYYTAENAPINPSSPTFAQITLQAKKQSALTYISNELILDANADAENVMRNNLIREMAIDKDKQILLGDGSLGAPTGLLNAKNVATVAMGGAHLAFTDLTNIVYQVEVLNGSTYVGIGQAKCTGVVGHPIMKRQIGNWVDTAGRPLWAFGLGEVKLPGDTDSLANWLGAGKFVTSTIMPGTEGQQKIIAGDWQHLLVADRMDLEFASSSVAGTAFASDQTAVRVIHRYDTAVAHPEAFTVLSPVSS